MIFYFDALKGLHSTPLNILSLLLCFFLDSSYYLNRKSATLGNLKRRQEITRNLLLFKLASPVMYVFLLLQSVKQCGYQNVC